MFARWRPCEELRKRRRLKPLGAWILGGLTLGWMAWGGIREGFSSIAIYPLWALIFFRDVDPTREIGLKRARQRARQLAIQDLFLVELKFTRKGVQLGSDTGLMCFERGLLHFEGSEITFTLSSKDWQVDSYLNYKFKGVNPFVFMNVRPIDRFNQTKRHTWSIGNAMAEWLDSKADDPEAVMPPLKVHPDLLVQDQHLAAIRWAPLLAVAPLAIPLFFWPQEWQVTALFAAIWAAIGISGHFFMTNRHNLMRAQSEINSSVLPMSQQRTWRSSRSERQENRARVRLNG
jgi:hypothetical protein